MDSEIVDYPIFIRSFILDEKKKSLENYFPEQGGAWEVFRFIRNNFKCFGKIYQILKEKNLTPSPKVSKEYLEERFQSNSKNYFDNHVQTMSQEELVRIHTYIIMYESIKPNYPEENSTISDRVINKYAIHPFATDVKYRKYRKL